MTPEARARQTIDALLAGAGWAVCDPDRVDLSGPLGVAIREFPLAAGHGFADYLLYVGGRAAGVIEAKPEGATLTGVEVQSGRYATGLPEGLPAWRRPLPFTYESTGAETHFTNGLDPEPRARGVFAFHRPETLRGWLLPAPAGRASDGERLQVAEAPASYQPDTFLARLRAMPELVTQWGEHTLWPAQVTAIRNLERSLARGRRRALIQRATGSGKTFTATGTVSFRQRCMNSHPRLATVGAPFSLIR
ncbi:MAG: DEAD/DEAH box helicase family protein, partial [Gammaproteobacteria bacterium]|nr:DEAD/DEAH box helicase family protein [Gammaproteobacteria bacterium]